MFIDIHQHHYIKPGVPLTAQQQEKYRYNYTEPEEVLRRYDALGIDKAIILPLVSPEPLTIMEFVGNEGALALHQAWPERFIPFCNVDPRRMNNNPQAPLGTVLELMKERGAKGVGEICSNLPFNHPLVENLFHYCDELELPVLFHIAPAQSGYYGLFDEPGLPLLERALNRYKKVTFIGHSQPFWAEIAPLSTPMSRDGYPKEPVSAEGVVPKLLRRYPNLMCDLSAGSGYNAIARDRAYGMRFLEEFADRMLFGTDIPGLNQPTPLMSLLQEARGADLSEESYQKICCGNATRLLHL